MPEFSLLARGVKGVEKLAHAGGETIQIQSPLRLPPMKGGLVQRVLKSRRKLVMFFPLACGGGLGRKEWGGGNCIGNEKILKKKTSKRKF